MGGLALETRPNKRTMKRRSMRNLRPYVVLAIAIQATGFLDLSNHHLVAAGSQGSLTRNILQPVR